MKVPSRFLFITGLIFTACTALPDKPPTQAGNLPVTPLDTSFGDQGVLTFSEQNTFVPLALQSTDKIVGYTFDATKPEAEQTHVLARLNADGGFDSSFTPGLVVEKAPKNKFIKLPDDSLIRMEIDTAKHTTRVTKFSADGPPDQTFGNQGVIELPFDMIDRQSACVDPNNGDVVFPAWQNTSAALHIPQGSHLLLARIMATGQMFGEYGFSKAQVNSNYHFYHCIISNHGDIIVTGTPDNDEFYSESFSRLSYEGVQDPAYYTSLDGSGLRQSVSALTLDQNGRVLVGAEDGVSSDVYFGRLTPLGKDDLSFYWRAFYSYPRVLSDSKVARAFKLKTSYQNLTAIFPLKNQKIFVVGKKDADTLITQFKENGDLETTFNETGKFEVPGAVHQWSAVNQQNLLYVFALGQKAKLYRIKAAP